jgi:hypothetical protein
LDLLSLRFEGVDALGKRLPVLLVLFDQPQGLAGTHQGNDRDNNDKDQQAQPNQCAEEFQHAFHRIMTPQELPRILAPKYKTNNDTTE